MTFGIVFIVSVLDLFSIVCIPVMVNIITSLICILGICLIADIVSTADSDSSVSSWI